MFERYTEKARRAIFFARYEASQFGSLYIETEHLLLGLLREDKALGNRLLGPHSVIESIRKQIEARTAVRDKVSTSVDLPLAHACKRVLAYAAEEAKLLNHNHIGTPHLLVGLLREESLAAQLLREQGVTPDSLRKEMQQSESPVAQRGSAFSSALDQWLAERKARGGIWIANQERMAGGTTHFAIYADPPARQDEEGETGDPARRLWLVQKRIDSAVAGMENAIANHEFEKARFYSDEERKERENLRQLCEQFNLVEAPRRFPFLCIEIVRDDRFSEILQRCDKVIFEGAVQVWILDPHLKRAYTITERDGLRECKGGLLRIADPPLEMDLKKIFD